MTECLGRALVELADGRLVGKARERALAHVAACASCREALETQRSIRGLLASSAAPEPSSDLVLRLRDVAQVPPSPASGAAPTRGSARRTRRVVAGGASALVASVAVVGALTSVSQTAASPPTVVPSLSRFAADHASAAGTLPLGGPALAGPSSAPTVIRVSAALYDLPPAPRQR